MNLAQRIILLFGLLIAAGLCLRPPYRAERTIYLVNPETGASREAGVTFESMGHQWLWNPPASATRRTQIAGYFSNTPLESRNVRLDWPRLSVYVGLTAGATFVLALIARR